MFFLWLILCFVFRFNSLWASRLRNSRHPTPQFPSAGPLQPRHSPAVARRARFIPRSPRPTRLHLPRSAPARHLVRGVRLGCNQPVRAWRTLPSAAFRRRTLDLPRDLQNVGHLRRQTTAHLGFDDLRGTFKGRRGRLRGWLWGAVGVREERPARIDGNCFVGWWVRQERQAGGVHEGVELFAVDQAGGEGVGGELRFLKGSIGKMTKIDSFVRTDVQLERKRTWNASFRFISELRANL